MIIKGVFTLTLTKGGPGSDNIPPEVPDPIEITTSNLKDGFQNIDYGSVQLTVINAVGTVVWTITDGVLPNGLSMTSGGLITGVPDTVEDQVITFRATDDVGFDEAILNIEIKAIAVGEHGYFDDLVEHEKHFTDYSLRSQNQLDGLVNRSPSSYFIYDPVMDAAKYKKMSDDKLGFSSDATPGDQNLKKMFCIANTGSVLVTFDTFHPPEWKYSKLKKIWKVHRGDGNANETGGAWITHFVDFPSPPTAPLPSMGEYSISVTGNSAATVPGVKLPFESNNAGPCGEGCGAPGSVNSFVNTWTRHWMQLEFGVLGSDARFNWWRNVGGVGNPHWDQYSAEAKALFEATTYVCYSYWLADDNRSVQRIYINFPVAINANAPFIQTLFMEFNTSALPPSQIFAHVANASTNGDGTIITMPGADLSLVQINDEFKLTLGVDSTPAKDQVAAEDMRTIVAVNNTTKEVTIEGTPFTGNLTDQLANVYGPIHMWVRNWVSLKDYSLPSVPETDTFIFRQPTGVVSG